MTTRMLIDARHREETRVAVVKGNRIEEFDFESAEHKQLKGNIYLAKVTRVEPSLQAAFIDYGGNRHGFLAFSEIHPDYYQIPKEDRERLLREEAEHAAEEAALRGEYDDDVLEGDVEDDGAHDSERDDEHDEDHGDARDEERDDERDHDQGDDRDREAVATDSDGSDDDDRDDRANGGRDDEESAEGGDEARGGDQRGGRGRGGRGRKPGDAEADELRRKRMALRRRYKIQDVIHRRQVLLVQIVKEERGNKGAALTTYLSLAGRYCVLMPNTSHGGGISRKISNTADRKRLKTIIAEMNLPSTMGCIVRTAGLQRTKPEIRRDFDYLARLWDEIREKTLRAVAPALIHNDSDLIKRAIRDIYNREIEEVIVEGEDGYRAAKDFMKLLMPSHARKVKAYADAVSLYQRFGVEDQLAAMYHPVVQLKSGGYLVINPTEALVSIDINSGRSTREHGIEQTAVATNLEAAREIARQLRLRDMAGLVVIDFIDMEVNSNVRKVEKAMKDALKDDRARIQVGRISSFGLMEMSRQRLRTGVLEASTRGCPHCEGTGLVRTASSAGLSALRLLEEEAARGKGSIITLRASQEAAFYVLNNKRRELDEIENRYGVRICILPDGETEGARMSVDASGPRPERVVTYEPIVDLDEDDDFPEEEYELEEEEEAAEEPRRSEGRAESRGDRDQAPARAEDGEGEGGRRRRRRRRGRRGRPDDGHEAAPGEGAEAGAEAGEEEAAEVNADSEEVREVRPAAEDEDGDGASRRGRRGRRGGRRRRGGRDREEGREGQDAVEAQDGDSEAGAEPEAQPVVAEADAEPVKPARKSRSRKKVEVEAEAPAAPEPEPMSEPIAEDAPKPRRSRAKAKAEPVVEAAAVVELPPVEAEAPAKPKRPSRRKGATAETSADAMADNPATLAPAPTADPEPVSDTAAANDADIDEETGEPRRGWWQRTFGN